MPGLSAGRVIIGPARSFVGIIVGIGRSLREKRQVTTKSYPFSSIPLLADFVAKVVECFREQ
jgi:hypothetical protein